MTAGQPTPADLPRTTPDRAQPAFTEGEATGVAGDQHRHVCQPGLVDVICAMATSPTPAGLKYLEDTANNLPARKARRSQFNGSVKVWDEKMPFTQEGESHSGEYPLSIELAHDKRIKRYFFQAQRIALDYINGAGRRVRTTATPDCLVELVDGRLALVEMVSDDEVVKEQAANNPRFSQGEVAGRIVDQPLTESCRPLGIAVVVLSTANVNHVLFENYLYLGKGFDKLWSPGEGTEAFVTFIRNTLVADLAEVRSKPNGWKMDDVLGAIAHQMVYVDLRCQRLGDHSNARVYASRQHAEAQQSAPQETPLLPTASLTDPKLPSIDLSGVSDAAMAEAWNRWAQIKPFICSDQTITAPPQVKPYIRSYEKAAKEHGAGLLGLIPNFSDRGFHGSHLPERIDQLTNEHVELAALNTNPSPDVGPYGALILACKAEGLEPPSRTTFQKRLKARRAQADSTRAQFGDDGEYQLRPAQPLTTSTLSRLPQRAWALGLLDHTPLPNRILEAIYGTPLIGVTPWLTYLRDADIDKTLGMYISLSRPTYVSVMATIWDCFRRHGRVPESLLLDGEKPHDSISVEQLLAEVRVDKICRRYLCPRDGNPVERDFKLLIHGLLVYLQGNYALRPNPHEWPRGWDPAKFADRTLASLYTACCTFMFGFANQELPRKALGGLTPDAAMAASLRIHGERAFRVHPDPKQARHILLPRHSRTLLQLTRDSGVRPFGEPYVPSQTIDPAFFGQKVAVRFDPFDITYVLARLGNQWVELKHRHYLKYEALQGDQLAAISIEVREAAARFERSRPERIEQHASVLERIQALPKDPLADFVKTLNPDIAQPAPVGQDLWERVKSASVAPAASYQEII